MNDQPNMNTLTTQTEDAQQGGEVVVQMPQKKAPLVASTRGGSMAIIPTDIDQAFRLSTAICAADMAPKSYKRDCNAVMVGILHGMEVGFTPMAALQSIAVINGMPSIWGDGALALIEASGLLEDKEERIDVDADGGMVAVCRMKRKGRSWTEQTFSWQDAKIAKLDQKDTYKLYGRRMLQRRARAWCMTDGFADVLRGLHIREAVDMGALEQAASGNYEPVQEAKPTVARPTRDDKAAAERARKVAKAQDQVYRQTMAEDSRSQPSHDAATGEVLEPGDDSADEADAHQDAPQAQEKAKASAPANTEHVAVENLLRKKLDAVKGTTMFKSSLDDYGPELDLMRSEDEPRYKKLMADIYAKHPSLKG